MHIFLTGSIQVGKSTIINQVLKELGLIPGGFRTFSGPFADGSRDLYIAPAGAENPLMDDAHRVGRRFGLGRFQVYPQAFDEAGVDILAQGRGFPLILMDEIGFMESAAPSFQQAVLKVLSGDIPVLGVLRLADTPFISQIRAHSKVSLLLVEADNRADIYEQVLRKLAHLKPGIKK